jgi:uncharacterized membrane protein YhhN
VRRSRTKLWAAAYWGCAAAHGVGHLLDLKPLRVVAKTALMPVLAGWGNAHGCPRLLTAALLLSSAGDSLMERKKLLPGLVMYAGAHCCYVTLFVRDRRRSSWQTAVVYGGLGELRAPVTGYSVLLTATAVTSSWYGRRTGLGGALFLVSDVLIASRLAGHDFPARSPLVGITYTAAQYQLAAGVVARTRAKAGAAPTLVVERRDLGPTAPRDAACP